MSSANDTFDPYAKWLGLNLREQPLDHYLLLGLRRYETDLAVIERHADERMRLVRSFQTGPRGRYTQKLMNELAAAKLCLLSPPSKRAYDEQLALWTQGAGHPSRGVEDETVVVDAELPPVATPAAGPPPFVLPPPVGSAASGLPPAAPPIGALAEAQEVDEAKVDGFAAPSRATVAVGLLLGFLVMGLTGWAVTRFVLKEPSVDVATQSSDSPGVVDDATDVSLQERDANSFRAPGSGRIDLPEEGEAIEVLQEGSGDVVLSPATAMLTEGVELTLEGTDEVIAGWSTPEDAAAWRFRLIQPGFFQLQVQYAAGDAAFGRKLELLLDDQAKSLELQPASDGYRTDLLTIAVTKSGPHELRLRQTSAFEGELRVKLVRLQAVAK